MTLPTNADVDAALPTTGGSRPKTNLANALVKNILAEMSAVRRDSVSPRDFSGDPSGTGDSTAAVAAVISAMNADGVAGRFDNGIWRVTSALPQINRPMIVGDGSGEIFVDYNPTAGSAIFDCRVPIGEVYTVTAVATATLDWNAAYTDDSTVTKLTLSLGGGQSMPVPGSVGKLTATNVLVGNDNGTDQAGQHVEILAVSGSDVFVPWFLHDTFSTSMQLVMLGPAPVGIGGLRFRGNYANVVSQDQRYTFLRVQGAIAPQIERMRFRDGCEAALLLAGCYLPSTRGIRAQRMRSALLSESPPIAGYGVVDAGCWLPTHHDLGGHDCRHIYTTVTLAPAADRVAWGRVFRPLLIGGQATGCSAAAYDTHSDAVEPEFQGLRAVGGYLGEASGGHGFQIRGTRGRIVGCAAVDVPVGFQFHKLSASEGHEHTLIGSRYRGPGVAARCTHDGGITGSNARQKLRLGACVFESPASWIVGLAAADLELVGHVNAIAIGAAAAGCRAVEMTEASTIKSAGGKLVYDFAGISSTPNPRVLNVVGDGNAAPGLDIQVVAGTKTWRGVVVDTNNPAAANGDFLIACDADAAPTEAAGAWAQFGSGTLLAPAGCWKGILTLQGARPGANKTASFSVTAFDRGRRFNCTSALTVTVPSAAVLGEDFECFIAAFAAVTIDGPGATNVNLSSGQIARVTARNGALQAYPSTATVIS